MKESQLSVPFSFLLIVRHSRLMLQEHQVLQLEFNIVVNSLQMLSLKDPILVLQIHFTPPILEVIQVILP